MVHSFVFTYLPILDFFFFFTHSDVPLPPWIGLVHKRNKSRFVFCMLLLNPWLVFFCDLRGELFQAFYTPPISHSYVANKGFIFWGDWFWIVMSQLTDRCSLNGFPHLDNVLLFIFFWNPPYTMYTWVGLAAAQVCGNDCGWERDYAHGAALAKFPIRLRAQVLRAVEQSQSRRRLLPEGARDAGEEGT
jgi:hypothetical protein